MTVGSIFFDIVLPTPTTWFYFSGLLAVALFFKFSRLFSIRNLDVLTLYLFTPGLLLLMEPGHALWGFVWLVSTCLYFLARCLADLAIVRRPALGSNLDLSGLAWLAGALFFSLIAVAARLPVLPTPVAESAQPTDPVHKIGTEASKPFLPTAEPSLRRLWAERSLAVLCHLSVIVGLVLIGWRHFDDVQAGMSAATFYLLLPYTFLLLPDSAVGVGRWDHAWPMALMVWTIFTYRRPVLAGAFFGVAAGTAPILLVVLPAWLSFYRHRGATRFVTAFLLFAVLGVAALGSLAWVSDGQPSRILPDWLRVDWWQAWLQPMGPSKGVWEGMHPAYRAPVMIASLALVIMSAFWPSPKNLAHVIALSAAALLSVQFWYADRGGVHILWFLPLLLLLVFRPNLSSALPPTPQGEDWLLRLMRGLGAWLASRLRGRRAVPVGGPPERNGG